MRRSTLLVALLGFVAIAPRPGAAHHSAAAFDPELPVRVSGKVTELAWTSPHARLYVDVEQEGGGSVNWNFELPSPNGLMRKGWSRRAVAPGDTVTVTGIRAREHALIAIATTVVDETGKSLFAGSGTD